MVLYAGAYIKGVYSNIRYRIHHRITNHLHSVHAVDCAVSLRLCIMQDNAVEDNMTAPLLMNAVTHIREERQTSSGTSSC